MQRWIGKIAIVTGASSGIGDAIARSLTIGGMNVVGLARREDRLKKLSKELNSSKGSFKFFQCDISKENDILKALEYVEKEFGGIDVLVNNAGIAVRDTIGVAKTETLKRVLDVNVLAPTIFTREALKSIRSRKSEGHIININSILGLHTSHFSTDINLYSASKFALSAMADTVRNEITQNKDNIRITNIHPGLVKTELLHSGHGDEIYDVMPHIESGQVANCVIFALSAPPGTQVSQIVIKPLHEKI